MAVCGSVDPGCDPRVLIKGDGSGGASIAWRTQGIYL